ncbi:unnamed protein product [Effrenium voratum]|nr:unnamed protein product [Effrenium voratum]
MAFGLRLFALFLPVRAWNSHHLISQIYSFQDFYTDAQYGPDFGYYSTGRILHQQEGGGQEWFNSYTTLPMSLSPYFAQALCDRVVSMWVAMGKPHPFVIMEFGGGTGMLARDILAHARDAHPEFFAALSSYFIAERSQAMRAAQNSTAAEFVSLGKLRVLPADGRHAHTLRKNLEGPDGRSAGLLDFLMPVAMLKSKEDINGSDIDARNSLPESAP